MGDAAHQGFGPQGLPIGADLDGELVDAKFAQQQPGAQPSRGEFLESLAHGLLQMPCLVGIERVRISGTAQFRRQCFFRKQFAQTARQTRAMGFDALHGVAHQCHFDRMLRKRCRALGYRC